MRLEAMIEEKVKGHEITAAPEAPHKPAPVIDLMEALKRSIRDMSRAPATRAAVLSPVERFERLRCSASGEGFDGLKIFHITRPGEKELASLKAK